MFLIVRFACGHWMRLASFFEKLAQVGHTAYCFECNKPTEITSVNEEE